MKYQILKPIKLQTTKGTIELKPEKVITFKISQALPLMNQEKIEPYGRYIRRIYSKMLDEYIWIVQNEVFKDKIIKEGVTEVIYTLDEIEKIKDSGMTDVGIIATHKVKRNFNGSGIFEIEDIEKEVAGKSPFSTFCQKCGKPGERHCFGDAGDKYRWGSFCLKCEPYNE